MPVACLVDTTRCIGCRSCQVACKQSNGLKGEDPRQARGPAGAGRFTPKVFTFVSFHELEGRDGRPRWIFVKRQCLHCAEQYCATVCPAAVFQRTPSGVVDYQPDKCQGCGACIDACPWRVPTVEYWDLPTPQMRKCGLCLGRQEARVEEVKVNGRRLAGESLERHVRGVHTPACVKACPAGALRFGPRDKMLEEARRRIAAAPGRYAAHVYGEREGGGCAWLYLAGVPMDKLGFPTRVETPPKPTAGRMG